MHRVAIPDPLKYSNHENTSDIKVLGQGGGGYVCLGFQGTPKKPHRVSESLLQVRTHVVGPEDEKNTQNEDLRMGLGFRKGQATRV